MRNRLLLIFTLFLFLSGCNKKEEKVLKDLQIITPTGAPSLAFYKYANDTDFETNSNPKNIISSMTSNGKDIVIIDTVSGIKAINNGAPYLLGANITFGNFYIASTGNDENETMEIDDKIAIFSQNQTPDLLFHYIYGDIYDENIEYVSAVSDCATILASGKNLVTGSTIDYVFIAQPVLYKILNNTSAKTYGKAKIYANIVDLYKQKSGNLDLVQASLFIKNDYKSKDQITNFLDSIEQDIKDAIDQPSSINSYFDVLSDEEVGSKYGITSNIMVATLTDNSIGLGYKKAIDNKQAIDAYINLFGMSSTNEEIYYK